MPAKHSGAASKHRASSVLALENEPDVKVFISRSRMSFYLKLQGPSGNAMVKQLKEEFPWIVEYAAYYVTFECMRFKNDALIIDREITKRFPVPGFFPLSRKHHKIGEGNFIEQTVMHFLTNGMLEYIERSWKREHLASGNTKGVLRALIFGTDNAEQRRLLISLLFEIKTMSSVYRWRLMLDEVSADTLDFNACCITRKLFWGVVHLYSVMCTEFDRSRLVSDWNSCWYTHTFEARKADAILQTIRAVVCRSVNDCDKFRMVHKELLQQRDTVLPSFELP
jgi:hypothetical protein